MILRPVLMPVPDGDSLPRNERAQEQHRISRLALAESARLSGVSARDWSKDDNDVPQPAGGIYWSLSHKPAWTAAVVSDRPVGIDIERIAARNPGMFDRLADPDEWGLLGGREWGHFFRLWTAKEAALKANGVGISGFGECRLVSILDDRHLTLSFGGRDWPIEHFFHDSHVAAVTTVPDSLEWTVGGLGNT